MSSDVLYFRGIH